MALRAGIAVGLAAIALSTAAVAAPAHAATPTPAATNGIGIRLLDVPSEAGSDPRARAYIVDELSPGTTIRRRVQVDNNTDTAQSVTVYAGAAAISGDTFIGAEGSTANELTGWITPAVRTLSVAAHTAADDTITIAVPADAAGGERYAAIWAEIRASLPSAAGGGAHTSITGISRVGIRVYLAVAAGNAPQAAFRITSMTAQRDSRGRPGIRAEVQNTGGRAVDLSGTLALSGGPGGLSAGPFAPTRVVTLAPGATGSVEVLLSASLPRGPWDARLTLTSGLLSHALGATITFPPAASAAPASPAASPAAGSGGHLLRIVLGAALVLILVAATYAAVRSHRRRLRRR